MTRPARPLPTVADFSVLVETLAEAEDDSTAFVAIAEAAANHIGHELFTIMAFHADAVQVERLYSSRPDAYPTGRRKEKRDTAWGRLVLEQGQPYIGRTVEDIRAHFDDHQLILGLGLESVLNVPVRVNGRTIGTMNLLHQAAYYDEGDLICGRLLAGLLAGPLAARR